VFISGKPVSEVGLNWPLAREITFRNESLTNEVLILRAAKNARLKLAKLNLLGQNSRIAPDQSRLTVCIVIPEFVAEPELPFRFRLKFSHRAQNDLRPYRPLKRSKK